MIVLYKGARGRGKTLSMVKDGLKFFCNGYKILRNFQCSFGDFITNDQILNLDKHSNIFDCVIMIDEIQIFFDARRGMLAQNILFSNFVQQTRKRNITILCTSQYSNNLDLRIRQHLDVLAYPNFIKRFCVCEITYIDLTKLEDSDIHYGQVHETLITDAKLVFDAEPIFELYNTEEMIR